MDNWESARNAKIKEYLSDAEESSYDFIARDIWFRNGAKADLLRYRHESREFKVVGVYEPENENGVGEEMVKALRDIGDLLISESFKYEITSMRADNMSNNAEYDIEGDYYATSGLEDTLMHEIGDLFRPSDIYESLHSIRSK